MTRLTANFTSGEFACQCGCGFDKIDPRLVARLQLLRDYLKRPIVILSGCRCPSHNAAVGGAPKSQHLLGIAADIRVAGMTARELYAAASLLFRGYGRDDERNFLHVDMRAERAKWTYHGGREAPWTD